MSDLRHQRDFSRAEYNQRSQAFYERVYGVWTFYKMNLATGKTETVKLAKAGLEINTAIFLKGIISNVRLSEKRSAYFAETNSKDVDWFCAVEEMKKGAKVWTPQAVYWAAFTAPAKREVQTMQAVA